MGMDGADPPGSKPGLMGVDPASGVDVDCKTGAGPARSSRRLVKPRGLGSATVEE